MFLERLLPFLSQIALTNLSESSVGKSNGTRFRNSFYQLCYNLVYCVLLKGLNIFCLVWIIFYFVSILIILKAVVNQVVELVVNHPVVLDLMYPWIVQVIYDVCLLFTWKITRMFNNPRCILVARKTTRAFFMCILGFNDYMSLCCTWNLLFLF